MSARAKSILYAEGDENDVWLMERAFRVERLKESLHSVHNGLDAIAWLAGAGDFEDRLRFPLPELVLLTVQLPKADGLEVLRWIRSHPRVATLPVVMFSGRYQEQDVADAYRLGANVFLEKPANVDELRQIARFLRTWLRDSLLPPVTEGMWRAMTVWGLPPRMTVSDKK
jgi:CheY-like chemotaxis protein